MIKIKKGTVVQDWYGKEIMGTYVVSIIPLGNLLGDKWALVSLNGQGVANGYRDSLEELEKSLNNSGTWKTLDVNLEELIEEKTANQLELNS